MATPVSVLPGLTSDWSFVVLSTITGSTQNPIGNPGEKNGQCLFVTSLASSIDYIVAVGSSTVTASTASTGSIQLCRGFADYHWSLKPSQNYISVSPYPLAASATMQTVFWGHQAIYP